MMIVTVAGTGVGRRGALQNGRVTTSAAFSAVGGFGIVALSGFTAGRFSPIFFVFLGRGPPYQAVFIFV